MRLKYFIISLFLIFYCSASSKLTESELSKLENLRINAVFASAIDSTDLCTLEIPGLIKNGKKIANQIRNENMNLEFSVMPELFSGLREKYRKENLTDSDGYRGILIAATIMAHYSYDYEQADSLLAELDNNIKKNVTNPTHYEAWQLLREQRISYIIDPQWYEQTNASQRKQLMSSNPELSPELYLWMALAELNDLNSYTHYATASEAKQLIQSIKNSLNDFSTSEFLYQQLEPDFLMAEIICDYDNSLLAQIKLKRLLEGNRLAAYNKANFGVGLGVTLNTYGDPEGRYILGETIETLDSIAKTETQPSQILAGYIKQQLFIQEQDNFGIVTEYNNDSTDIKLYEETMRRLGDDVKSNRCKADIIEVFSGSRVGQSSTLPLQRTATDYLAAVIKDPYTPFRIHSIISAASKLANAGKITEALSMIDINSNAPCILPRDISPQQKIDVYKTLAEIYSLCGNFEKTYENMCLALKLMEKYAPDNHILLFDTTYGLFQCARHLGKPETGELAKKMEAIRSYLPDKQWEHEADWSIAFHKANDAHSRKQHIRQLKNIYNLAVKKNIPLYQREASYALASAYIGENNLQDAANWYRQAYELSENQPIDIPFINDYLNFLYTTVSDRAQWYRIFNRVLTDIERNRMDMNVAFIELLSSQMANILNSGNFEDYSFLLSTFCSKLQALVPLMASDLYAVWAIKKPIIDVLVDLISQSQYYPAEQYKEIMNSVRQMTLDWIEEAILHREKLNLLPFEEMVLEFKRAQLWITSGDIPAAQKSLNKAYEIAASNNNEQMFENMSFWVRVNIAKITQNSDELEKLMNSSAVTDMIASASASNGNIETVVNTFAMLYNINTSNGKYSKALSLASKRFDIMRQFIETQFFNMGETHKEALLNNGFASPWDAYALLPLSDDPGVRCLAYNETIFYKNLLLESSESMHRAVYATNDNKAISQYQRLLALRREKGSMTYDATDANCQRRMTDISRAIYALEDSISVLCEHHGTISKRRFMDFSTIAKSLDKDEAAIEFIACGDRFGALILKHKSKVPVYIELAKGADVAEWMKPLHTIGKLNSRIKDIYTNSSKYNGGKLYDGIWAPIEFELNGISRIYYTTSGYLSTIALSALEDSTRTSLCERYDMRLLSTTSMLPEIKRNDQERKRKKRENLNAVAFGAIPYDLDGSTDRNFKELINSGREVALVDSICKANNISIQCITSADATEERFCELSGSSPAILLLSTHGYYFDREKASTHDFYINKGLTSTETQQQRNLNIPAIMRGGLAFAGCNPVWNNQQTKDNENDGILTGLEISQLDLSQNELLILSACETGLGETTSHEGVDGIQRGFKQAGSQSIIMTLWEANDRQTMRFMQIFFETLAATSDRHQAFKTAQLTLKKESPTIALWAPFIMLD